MKIYEKIVIDMESGEVLDEVSYEYDGPLALCNIGNERGDAYGDGTESDYDGEGSDTGGTGDSGGDLDPDYLDDTSDNETVVDPEDDDSDPPEWEDYWEDYLKGPWEGVFDGTYREGLPSMSEYMRENMYGPGGPGTMYDYMSTVKPPTIDPLSDYISQINTNPEFSAAWDEMYTQGANQLGERLYGSGFGGSARGGHSGAGAAAYGEYTADQIINRYKAALQTAMPQWQAQQDVNIQDWRSDLGARATDYDMLYRQNVSDFGSDLQAYQMPYNMAAQIVPQHMNMSIGGSGTEDQGNAWGSIIGGVAGGALGWYMSGGNPYGAYTGYTLGSGLGSQI